MRGLSFLQGHIAADIDHVKENAEQLNQIMTAESNQQKLDEVVALGEETVNLYIDYFEQVMVLAKRQQKQQRELDQRIAV